MLIEASARSIEVYPYLELRELYSAVDSNFELAAGQQNAGLAGKLSGWFTKPRKIRVDKTRWQACQDCGAAIQEIIKRGGVTGQTFRAIVESNKTVPEGISSGESLQEAARYASALYDRKDKVIEVIERRYGINGRQATD